MNAEQKGIAGIVLLAMLTLPLALIGGWDGLFAFPAAVVCGLITIVLWIQLTRHKASSALVLQTLLFLVACFLLMRANLPFSVSNNQYPWLKAVVERASLFAQPYSTFHSRNVYFFSMVLEAFTFMVFYAGLIEILTTINNNPQIQHTLLFHLLRTHYQLLAISFIGVVTMLVVF